MSIDCVIVLKTRGFYFETFCEMVSYSSNGDPIDHVFSQSIFFLHKSIVDVIYFVLF